MPAAGAQRAAPVLCADGGSVTGILSVASWYLEQHHGRNRIILLLLLVVPCARLIHGAEVTSVLHSSGARGRDRRIFLSLPPIYRALSLQLRPHAR